MVAEYPLCEKPEMKRFLGHLGVVGCSLAALFLFPSSVFAMEAQDVFKQADPSIVVVVASDQRKETLGSGVMVAPTEVATTCHIVRDASKIIVTRGAVLRGARLRYQDQARDLCQLRLDDPFPDGKPISAIVPSKDLESGQQIFVIGSPKGLEHTISRGIVSGLRNIKGETGRLIQTDAAASPGSSGSGLFDQEARLIGLVSFQFKESQNLNFAIPAEWIAELAQRTPDRLKEGPDAEGAKQDLLPDAGTASRKSDNSLVKVGDRWNYRLSDRGRTVRTVSVQITEVDGIRVKERITAEGFSAFRAERDIEIVPTLTRFQSAISLPGGYQLVELAPYLPVEVKLSAGQRLGKIPIEFFHAGVPKQSQISEAKVVGRETVRVPAGTFETWKVEATANGLGYQNLPLQVKSTLWYAPNVARTVKMVFWTFAYNQVASSEEVYELMSFAPGK